MNLKPHHLYRILVPGFLFVILLSLGTVQHTHAQNSPTQITLNMFALRQSDGAIDPSLPDARCYSVVSNRTRYGCTCFPGDLNRDYPFQSDTIVLNIEGDTTLADDGSQQGYLHNVISQEMAEGSSLASYTAQAIAARTYAYYQTSNGTLAINNSASKQVYLPYRYEGLATSTRRQIVHNAVTLPGSLYMTQQFSTASINAHFGQDNCSFTEQGAAPYLMSIYDPISIKPSETDGDPGTTCSNSTYGTGYGGMGSAGASRWGYGHTSEYNRDDLGDPWSVRWGDYPANADWRGGLQILTHYYTGVDILNQYGQSIDPDYRWDPLKVSWGGSSTPPPMFYGGDANYWATVTLQNVGNYGWVHPDDGSWYRWYLGYRWRKDGNVQTGNENVEIVQFGLPNSVQRGEHRAVTLMVHDPPNWGSGTYTLELDVFYENIHTGETRWISEIESNRPWFTHKISISPGICAQDSNCAPTSNPIYLPIIFKSESPPPPDCIWEDNWLDNGNFGGQLANWDVWIDSSSFGGFQNSNLYTYQRYDPGDSAPAAYLGGENDRLQPSGGDFADQYIAQSIVLPTPNNVEQLAIEYSYCLTSQETTTTYEYDKFFVDLQKGLGGGSVIPQALKYTNLNAASSCDTSSGNWRRRGRPSTEPGGDGSLIITNVDQFSPNETLTLVFYSDVDVSLISTFYFDAVKIKACVDN